MLLIDQTMPIQQILPCECCRDHHHFEMMPDAAVTVLDRTGTMNHLKVVVISAAFAGKNLLDRHRLVYQALDVPMKDGRIHALEITAQTTEEA